MNGTTRTFLRSSLESGLYPGQQKYKTLFFFYRVRAFYQKEGRKKQSGSWDAVECLANSTYTGGDTSGHLIVL